MKKKWLVGCEYEAIVIVDTEADSEEMILSFAQEEVHEADYLYRLPKHWNYADCLVYYSQGYWNAEVPILCDLM